MKLINKVLAAAAGILALSSCVEDAIAPLTGMYEKPVEYVMTEVKSQSVEKGENTRTFTVEIANNEATLKMKFVGNKYFLHDAAFNAAPADAAKVGNYIVGNGGSTFTLGGQNVNVDSGTLTVAQVEGKYNFSGILWLADESVIKVNATGLALVYEPDPEPVIMSTVLSASSNLASGVQTVSLSLAQEGISSEMDMTTYQTIWKGEGNYMSMDIYSADGYLHEGTYTACAVGGVVNEGEFGIGYDTTVDWGWGPMEMKDWGTCWWTVANGAATAQKILAGTVTVSKKGSNWVIELVSGEGKDMIWGKFTGAVPALTEPSDNPGGPVDDTEYTELVNLLSATSNVAGGTPSLTLNMATEGVSAVSNGMGGFTFSGSGNYLALDIYSADGKLYTGTYNASATAGAVAEGEFGIGWDPGDLWGIGMVFENWGTCWWSVDNGATSAEKVVDGTVEVAVEGANLVIKLKSTLINARFTYPTADFKDGAGNAIEVVNTGGGNEPSVEYEELVNLLSATSNVAGGTPSLTLNMATEGVSAVSNGMGGFTFSGSGNYLALDIYSADGKLYTGTYNAGATAGAVAEGEFGIGWDPGDLWGIGMVFENWGTCWWSVDNGATSAEKVVDGTIEVAVNGADLVITLESTIVNARFTYPVADFKDGTGAAIEIL